MKKSIFAVMAVVMVMALSVAAEAAKIDIINKTGVEIHELYLSDSGTDDWEEDVLGEDTLPNGKTLRIDVSGSVDSFDLKIVDEEGDSLEFRKLDGDASEITLKNDGTAEYN
jgi:hypothetical protein